MSMMDITGNDSTITLSLCYLWLTWKSPFLFTIRNVHIIWLHCLATNLQIELFSCLRQLVTFSLSSSLITCHNPSIQAPLQDSVEVIIFFYFGEHYIITSFVLSHSSLQTLQYVLPFLLLLWMASSFSSCSEMHIFI